MTHLPFVVPTFVLAVLVPLGFALVARARLRAATRRLAALGSR